jgi:hypothetical protein
MPGETRQLVSINRQMLNSFATDLFVNPTQAALLPSAPTPTLPAPPPPPALPPPPPPALPPPPPSSLNMHPKHELQVYSDANKQTTAHCNFTSFELFMIERLQKNKKLKHDESLIAMLQLHALRKMFQKRGTDNGKNMIQLVLIGFAPIHERNLFLRALRYATRARVFLSAYVEPSTVQIQNLQRFEIYIQAFVTSAGNILLLDVEHIMHYLQAWKLSLCCIDLGNCDVSDEALLTAVDRLETGRQQYGNWNCAHNFNFRQKIRSNIIARDEQRAREHVRQQTGLEFTPGNMLRVYYESQNARIEMSSLQYSLGIIRTNIANMMQELRQVQNTPNTRDTHETDDFNTNNINNINNTNNTNNSNNIDTMNRLERILHDPAWSTIPTSQVTTSFHVVIDLTNDHSSDLNVN